MRLGPVPESPLDLVAIAAGLAPRPALDTMMAVGLARTLMAATRFGVFEVLAAGEASAETVAERCGTDPRATRKLLDALAGTGYLVRRKDRYSIAPVAKKWLLADSRRSLHDAVECMELVWEWTEHYDEFVRTGRPLDVHRTLDDRGWALYQRAMRSLASLMAPEVAWRTPVPRGAKRLLDIGGSHGYFSVALCRRHRRLRATVLDLPDAVEHAAPLLEREGLGDRVTHRAADARSDELGEREWDVVFVANLVHHFDDAENRDLCRRAARALKPGGVLVLQEMIRPDRNARAHAGALADLYFAALSESGTWSYDEMASWQRAAGLEPRRPVRFVTYPGLGQQPAKKPRA